MTPDEIAELRADVERLTRELREARAALREYVPGCVVLMCRGLATHQGDAPHCDRHGSDLPDALHAPAIRAAEGET